MTQINLRWCDMASNKPLCEADFGTCRKTARWRIRHKATPTFGFLLVCKEHREKYADKEGIIQEALK